MNNFTKKGMVQKIIVMLIFLTVFNFVYPYVPVFADDDEEAPGGILLQPLLKLFSSIGEGIIYICQNQILGLGASSVFVDTGESQASGLIGTIIGIGAFALAPFSFGTSLAIGVGAGILAGKLTANSIPDEFYIPLYKISPQEIFSDQIPALHINFINPKTYENETYEDKNGETQNRNSAKILSSQIAKWYVALRNLVLIAMMVILLYIGIRIVISSASADKAKYKEHIKDWLVAIIIVVFMHYIMAFAMTIAEYITDMLNSKNEIVYYEFPKEYIDQIDNKDELSEYIDENGNMKFYTNIMGVARIRQQLEDRDGNGNEILTWSKIGYTIIYLALVFYTLMFLIIYLKRVIYMAFLTMIAPLVALTYPIDKMGDGQAQAFNMWLKEYIFNLLLQPFHLLLYTLLIGSVMDLATSNMIYALVALGFLLPAEKLLRKFFGFEKSEVAGSIMGGVVGGSLAMGAIQKLGSIGSGAGKGGKSSESGGSETSDDSNIRKRDIDGDKTTDDLLSEGFGGESNSNNNVILTSDTAAKARANNLFDRMYENNNSSNENRSKEMIGEAKERFMDNVGNPAKRMGSSAYNATIGKASRAMDKTALGRGAKRLAISGYKTAGAKFKVAGKHGLKGLKSMAKKAPRLVAQGAMGAATGAVGVAAGLASGDLSNVFTYGAAAAGVGASLGNAGANLVSNAADKANSMNDEYMKTRYTREEYKKKMNEKADKEFMKDEQAKETYKEYFGKDYKKAMETAKKYREYGITDDKAIISAMKLNLGNQDVDSKERMAYAKVASSVSSEKELKDYTGRLKDNGISDEKIEEIKKNVRSMWD